MSKKERNNEEQAHYWNEKARMFEIYGGVCGVCGASDHLTAHHIVAWSEGGSDDRSNLYPLCETDHRELEKKIQKKR